MHSFREYLSHIRMSSRAAMLGAYDLWVGRDLCWQYLNWHGTSVYTVSFDGRTRLVASYDKPSIEPIHTQIPTIHLWEKLNEKKIFHFSQFFRNSSSAKVQFLQVFLDILYTDLVFWKENVFFDSYLRWHFFALILHFLLF